MKNFFKNVSDALSIMELIQSIYRFQCKKCAMIESVLVADRLLKYLPMQYGE